MSSIIDSGLRTQDSGLRTQDSGLSVCFTPTSVDNNLYISLMQDAVTLTGCRLCKEQRSKALFISDIFHFNWDILLLNGRRRLLSLIRNIIYMYCIKALGKKIVYTLHDKIPLHQITNQKLEPSLMNKFMLKHADKVVVHCTESTAHIKNILPGINKSKIIYVPHPSYITAYRDAKPYAGTFRKDSKILITFIGTVQKRKCLDILVNVAKQLQERRDLHFLICGKGEKSYTSELEAMTQGSSNITTDFRFIDDDEIYSLLNMSDVVVLPYNTTSELNSGSAYLAFSFGRTIIGTRTGTTDDIKDQNLFYVYDYTDDEAEHTARLKESILRFYYDFKRDNGHTVREKGRKLRQIMIEEHSLEKTAEALRQAYGLC